MTKTTDASLLADDLEPEVEGRRQRELQRRIECELLKARNEENEKALTDLAKQAQELGMGYPGEDGEA